MLKLTGLHFLLTYQCTFECDHCFVWGSPWQQGTWSLVQVREALHQARELGTVESIYFEGGEPFLYYATLLACVREAHHLGFEVGVVTNAYWATSEEDARAALQPFTGLLQKLSISRDLFHYNEKFSRQARQAEMAAERLGISTGILTVERPEDSSICAASGQIPTGESGVMYRGRAVAKLAPQAARQPWEGFTSCPHEDLREPGRVHLDPLGYIHLCQGLVLGNLFTSSLAEICQGYDPDSHPIAGPLLSGGPAELARRYSVTHAEGYADACHLCYATRQALRPLFPKILAPDSMYGFY